MPINGETAMQALTALSHYVTSAMSELPGGGATKWLCSTVRGVVLLLPRMLRMTRVRE